MADVVSIASETVLEFIAREGGTVNTGQVSMRFGWDMQRARSELARLAKAQHIEKVGLRNIGWAGANDWRLLSPPVPNKGGR
jgi:hypothetical protein